MLDDQYHRPDSLRIDKKEFQVLSHSEDAEEPQSSDLYAIVDAIGASVAIVGRDRDGAVTVEAMNPFFAQMLEGRDGGSTPSEARLVDLIPRYARRDILGQLEKCFRSGQALEFEQAFDASDGTRWWRWSCKPIQSGSHERLFLTCIDISQKMELEQETKLWNSRFRAVIESAYDGIVTIDARHRIILFNRAAEELFGYSADEVLGQCIEVLVPEDKREHHAEHVERFARSPVRSREMSERSRVYGLHKNGEIFPLEIAISKLDVGAQLEFTAVVRDITHRVRLMEELAAKANTDALTGVPNRRKFTEAADTIWSRAMAQGDPVSLMILDVDRFKEINDLRGHAVGDEVLRALASVGAATVRHLDFFCRIGGEEFVILMPGTGSREARATAERIRKIYSNGEYEFPWSEERVPFTVSIGVAELSSNLGSDAVEEAMKRADAALYRAKGNGRDRVELAD